MAYQSHDAMYRLQSISVPANYIWSTFQEPVESYAAQPFEILENGSMVDARAGSRCG
jgi:hypothetical protein